MKNLLHHPLIVALIACLIFTPIGSYIYDHTKNIPILTNYILKPLSLVWNIIISIFIYKISIGAFLLFFSTVLLLIILINKIFYSAKITPPKAAPAKPMAVLTPVEEPMFLSYKKDNIKNWIWTWEYKKYQNGYRVENLKAHCPADDTTLIIDGQNFICPRCDKNYYRPFLQELRAIVQIHNIKVLIADNVRKKYNEIVDV